MKANKAPEKIYMSPAGVVYKGDKQQNADVDYTRTDAFIEKAVEWLKEHKEAVETEDNGIAGWIPDYFIEDFKKYMEGE